MDQTPVYFSMHPKKTFEMCGKRTINLQSSTDDTRRCTVAVTLTASGHKLPLLIIFKGKRTGKIATKELKTYKEGPVYVCQVNDWMDCEVMLLWVEQVLKPYSPTAPSNIRPILYLDSYRCHMLTDVVTEIQKLGVVVQHIPGGCTSYCQPVDVGFKKAFKNQNRRKWHEWIIDKAEKKCN